MYRQYNDYELISHVRENDEFCESIILKKYKPVIHCIVDDYYANYSKYGLEKEDFYQEALLAFLRALGSYNEEMNCSFYTFVVICIKRKLITFCRNISNSNKNISNDYLDDISVHEVCDHKADINNIINVIEYERIIKDVMYDLSMENSCIFELKYNNFTYREISILLDIPFNSVEYKYRQFKRQISKNLYKNGFI